MFIMNKTYSKEFKLGLTVIICAVILIFGINYLKGINILKPDNYYYVEMKNVQGLANSAPVTIDGFKVGLIREILYNYEKPGSVTVEISLDKQLKLPKGSKINMVTDLMGTASFNIELNKYVGSYYSIGDTIEGGKSAGLMDNITENVLPQLENMVPKIDSLLNGLNSLINESKLSETLINVNGITANLENASQTLNKVIKSDLPQIAANLKTTTNNFAQISENVKSINFDELYASVDRTLSNVNKITEDINAGTGTVGLLMKDPSIYNNLNSAISHIDTLMIDLKNNPKRYVHFSVFGRK